MERQFEGRSVAEAAIKACEVLGVTRSALRYRVISETGELLERRVVIAVNTEGLGNSSPTTPVTHASATSGMAPLEDDEDDPPQPSDNESRPRENSERARGNRGPRERDRGSRGGERSARGGRSGGGGGRSRDRDRDRGGRGGRGGRGDRDRNRPRPGGQDDDGIEALLKLDSQPREALPARAAIEAKSVRAKRALSVVEDLVRLLGMKLTAQLVADNETEMHIDLAGADEARMIGKKGEVLLALQFVVNRIISRGEEDGDQVVVLDAGGYRERRRNALQELAKRLAARALEERKAVRLSPMSAHDRRVFHMTLKEVEGVTTRSEGDGLYRNLLIIPSEFC